MKKMLKDKEKSSKKEKLASISQYPLIKKRKFKICSSRRQSEFKIYTLLYVVKETISKIKITKPK